MTNFDENRVREVAIQSTKMSGSFIRLLAFDKLNYMSPETEFDNIASRLTKNAILAQFPKAKIFIDTDDKNSIAIDDKELTWFVNPLNGRKAFTKGQFAFVCSSNAAWDSEGLIAASIYNPFTDITYSASRSSKGAYLNEDLLPKPRIVKKTNARILMDFSNSLDDNLKIALSTADVRGEVGRVLRFDGAIAQHLALIVQGALDAAIIWGSGSKGAYWDLAAALLLLDRQGYKITNLEGKAIMPTDKSFDQLVVAEPDLHKEIMDWIPKVKSFKGIQTDGIPKKRFFGLFG